MKPTVGTWIASALMLVLSVPGRTQEDMYELTHSETRRRSLALVDLQRNHGLSYPEALALTNVEIRARRALELLGVSANRVTVTYRDFLKSPVGTGDFHGPRIEISPKFGLQSCTELYSRFWRYYLEQTYGSWRNYKISDFKSGLMFPSEAARIARHLDALGSLSVRNGGAVTPQVLEEARSLAETSSKTFRPERLPDHVRTLLRRVETLERSLRRQSGTLRAAPVETPQIVKPVSGTVPNPIPLPHESGRAAEVGRRQGRSPRLIRAEEARIWSESKRSRIQDKDLEWVSSTGHRRAALLQLATWPGALIIQEAIRTIESSGGVGDFASQLRSIDIDRTAASLAVFAGASKTVDAVLSRVSLPRRMPGALRAGVRQGTPMALAMAAVDLAQREEVHTLPILRSTVSYMASGSLVDALTGAATKAIRWTPQGWGRTFFWETSKAGLVLWLGDKLDRGVWTGNWKPSRSRFQHVDAGQGN